MPISEFVTIDACLKETRIDTDHARITITLTMEIVGPRYATAAASRFLAANRGFFQEPCAAAVSAAISAALQIHPEVRQSQITGVFEVGGGVTPLTPAEYEQVMLRAAQEMAGAAHQPGHA